MGKVKYHSDIQISDVYRDEKTGFEGTATAVVFFEYGCERVTLERVSKHDGKIEEHTFDAPRLINVRSGKKAETDRTGGPRPAPTRMSAPTR